MGENYQMQKYHDYTCVLLVFYSTKNLNDFYAKIYFNLLSPNVKITIDFLEKHL